MSSFALDPRLAADTIALGDTPLSRVLLMNDTRFPWLILVPRRADLAEIIDLAPSERTALMEEVAFVSTALLKRPDVEKINIGALGNIVRQLHIHIVGRSSIDAAWPGPVWGFGARQLYDSSMLERTSREFIASLGRILIDQSRLAHA
jgi:diadenosine tetraphosphate (Ap4A) HIT family hydrolase